MQRAGKGANEEPREVGRKTRRALGVAIAAAYPGPRSSVGEKVRCSIPIHAIVCLSLRHEGPFDCLEPNAARTPRLKTGADSPRRATKSWVRRVLRPTDMVS
jgi:hypothetical protein